MDLAALERRSIRFAACAALVVIARGRVIGCVCRRADAERSGVPRNRDGLPPNIGWLPASSRSRRAGPRPTRASAERRDRPDRRRRRRRDGRVRRRDARDRRSHQPGEHDRARAATRRRPRARPADPRDALAGARAPRRPARRRTDLEDVDGRRWDLADRRGHALVVGAFDANCAGCSALVDRVAESLVAAHAGDMPCSRSPTRIQNVR